MDNTKKTINRNIAKSVNLERLLDFAAPLSDDPIIKSRSRGWFPRLVCEALEFYVKNKTVTVTTRKGDK